MHNLLSMEDLVTTGFAILFIGGFLAGIAYIFFQGLRRLFTKSFWTEGYNTPEGAGPAFDGTLEFSEPDVKSESVDNLLVFGVAKYKFKSIIELQDIIQGVIQFLFQDESLASITVTPGNKFRLAIRSDSAGANIKCIVETNSLISGAFFRENQFKVDQGDFPGRMIREIQTDTEGKITEACVILTNFISKAFDLKAKGNIQLLLAEDLEWDEEDYGYKENLPVFSVLQFIPVALDERHIAWEEENDLFRELLRAGLEFLKTDPIEGELVISLLVNFNLFGFHGVPEKTEVLCTGNENPDTPKGLLAKYKFKTGHEQFPEVPVRSFSVHNEQEIDEVIHFLEEVIREIAKPDIGDDIQYILAHNIPNPNYDADFDFS